MFTEERETKRGGMVRDLRAGDVRALRTSNAFWQTRVLYMCACRHTHIYIYMIYVHYTWQGGGAGTEVWKRCIRASTIVAASEWWYKRRSGMGIFDKWHRPYWYGQGLFQGQVRNGFFRTQHTYGLESPSRLCTYNIIYICTTRTHTCTVKRKYEHFFLFSSLLTITSTRFVRTSILVFLL